MAIWTDEDVLTILGGASQISAANQLTLKSIRPFAERAVKKHVGYPIEYREGIVEFYPDANIGPTLDPLVGGYELSTGGVAIPIMGNSTNQLLYLYQLPVRSITGIYENENAWQNGAPGTWPDASLVPVRDYYMDNPGDGFNWSGIVFRTSGLWSNSERAIKVAYTAGLTADELANDYSEFKMAVLLTLQIWWGIILTFKPNPITGAAPGVITSEGVAGWSQGFDAESQRRLFGMMGVLPPQAAQLLEDRVRMTKYI